MIEKIIWIDLETTGLDPDRDRILEFCAIITSAHLDDFRVFYPVTFPVPQDVPMSELVLAMHQRSGLLDACALSHDTMPAVEAAVIAWLEQEGCHSRKCPLGGFSPHFDRAFLRRHMPTLHVFLSHRHIDISTLRQLGEVWWPEIGETRRMVYPAHRAQADCLAAIATAMIYRNKLGVREGSNGCS